jgi:hypothetical protein
VFYTTTAPEGSVSSIYKIMLGALQTLASAVMTGASVGAAAAAAAGSVGPSRPGELAASSVASSSAACAISEVSLSVF